ncbi:Peroxidase [Rhynchospora pubera]|uniref:Peroxidase n=1 Tax=Rhynchospora pubera TaxID=906938 RepID=A0AAV8E0Q7_9POAL|nr:Peroxidase [Rhynchospora pubera]
MKCSKALKTTLLAILVLNLVAVSHGRLRYNFYNGRCGQHNVEAIIQSIVKNSFTTDPKIVAGLLRLQFHDCAVNGCDASILLDGPDSEKTASPNLSVFGYDLIDQIKVVLEAVCPGVVSCSDIIIAATRDATVLAGSPPFQVQMGRRDSLVSLASNVNLPSPDISVSNAIQFFGSKGLNPFDMVLLLGAHTVGVCHCSVINDRLYNYMGTSEPDPSMNPSYMNVLRNHYCPMGQADNSYVYLDDPSSALSIDNNYYKQLMNNKGILPIDQALTHDGSTGWMVDLLANATDFPSLFTQALVKLGRVEVLTGRRGQIRRNCRRIN